LSSLYQNIIEFVVISILLSILVYFINRSTLKTLGGEPRYAAEVVSRIASGDLSQTVNKKAGDNESLVHEMGVMREQLTSVIAEIRGVAEVINTSTMISSPAIRRLLNIPSSRPCRWKKRLPAWKRLPPP
jgi:methyl-accepting chemotaxis protein